MVWKKIRQWLHHSPHVHIRFEGICSLSDLVDLIDRFIDGQMKYDLEWDDFISWKHANPNIESIRQRIEATQPLLASGSKTDLAQFIDGLIEERNQVAALIGMPPRQK